MVKSEISHGKYRAYPVGVRIRVCLRRGAHWIDWRVEHPSLGYCLLDRSRIGWGIVESNSLIGADVMAEVSTKTLLAAIGLLDNQEMNATVFNRRFELIIKMIRGEVNDDDLRRYIKEFETERKSLDYLLDPETGEIGTYEQYRKSLF